MIEEVLPNAMYLVHLENGRNVRASVAPSLRHSVVRLIAGQRVGVTLSTHDPNRGRITRSL